MSKVGILVPCRKRPEYTEQCIKSLEEAQEYNNTTFHLVDDNSEDATLQILNSSTLPKIVSVNEEPLGLRQVVINFFKHHREYDYIVKVDNDCLVPKAWLNDILSVFSSCDVDIVSPNVNPSQAAFTYGKFQEGLPYRPTKTVGGLWAMKSSLIEDIDFDGYGVSGITGAFQLLSQIIFEKSPKVGWLPNVTFEDLGHHSGEHPLHIKSQEHREYSAEVRRRVSW